MSTSIGTSAIVYRQAAFVKTQKIKKDQNLKNNICIYIKDIPYIYIYIHIYTLYIYSDTSANEDNSFRNHIR